MLISAINVNASNPVDVPTETQDHQEIFQDPLPDEVAIKERAKTAENQQSLSTEASEEVISKRDTLTNAISENTPSVSNVVFSPQLVRPLPKASERKITNRGRKKRYTAIYTDTPEKEAVRRESEEIEKRKKRAQSLKKNLKSFANKENENKKKSANKKRSTTHMKKKAFFLKIHPLRMKIVSV